MARLLILALVALTGVVSARQGHLNPFAPRAALVEARGKLLPHGTSNHHTPLNYALPKYTPGDSCGSQQNCKECLINQVCVWLPFRGECVEDRDEAHMYGTMQCGSWTPDQLPVVTNEHDDYRLFHTRNDPRDFNIASLNGGQDVYGLAVDMEGRDPNDPDHTLPKGGGGEILNGVTHQGFTGNLLQHDKKGKMLPIGVKGKEYCPCKKDPVKFAAKACDCGYQEPIVNTRYK